MAIHFYLCDLDEIKESLARIEDDLKEIKLTMAVTKADFDQKFVELGQAIQEVANDINDLITKLQTGGLSDADEQAVYADLSTAVNQLQAIGAVWNPPPPPGP